MRAHTVRLRQGTAAVAAATLAAAGLVAAPAHATLTEGQLLVHYDFSGDLLSDGVVIDRTGHGLNGSLVNKNTAALVPGEAADDSALALPGGAPSSTGAYVELPKPLLDGTTDLTVSTRVRWDGTGGSWQRLFDLGENTTRYLFATPGNGDGNLRASITTNGPGGETKATGYSAMPANDWKTVTVTLDTGQHRLSLYLDGALVDAGSTDVTGAQLLSGAATRAGYIGKSQYPDPLLKGDVDDFQVYDTALSAAQVAELVGEMFRL